MTISGTGVPALRTTVVRGGGSVWLWLNGVLDLARAQGRKKLYAGTWQTGAGVPALEAMGFSNEGLGIHAVRRVDVHNAPHGLWQRLYDEALGHAAEYELVHMVGPTPDDLYGYRFFEHHAIHCPVGRGEELRKRIASRREYRRKFEAPRAPDAPPIEWHVDEPIAPLADLPLDHHEERPDHVRHADHEGTADRCGRPRHRYCGALLPRYAGAADRQALSAWIPGGKPPVADDRRRGCRCPRAWSRSDRRHRRYAPGPSPAGRAAAPGRAAVSLPPTAAPGCTGFLSTADSGVRGSRMMMVAPWPGSLSISRRT